MRRFDWPLFVLSILDNRSFGTASVARRRVRSMEARCTSRCRAAPISLDPADLDAESSDRTITAQPDSFARHSVTALIFDTLFTTDESGRIQPSLATSWQESPGSQRWQFRIRNGVKFHDGSALRSDVVAASLRAANPSWNVSVDGDSVVIDNAGSDSSRI